MSTISSAQLGTPGARLRPAPGEPQWHALLTPTPRRPRGRPVRPAAEAVTTPDWRIAPELKVITISLVAALVEVLCGRRPPHQLQQWATGSVAEQVEQLCSGQQHRDWRLRSLRAQQPNDHTVEATLHLTHAGRSRAAAIQIARPQGRWLITELCLAPQREAPS